MAWLGCVLPFGTVQQESPKTILQFVGAADGPVVEVPLAPACARRGGRERRAGVAGRLLGTPLLLGIFLWFELDEAVFPMAQVAGQAGRDSSNFPLSICFWRSLVKRQSVFVVVVASKPQSWPHSSLR